MSWGFVAIAGATVVGSVVQSNAAKKAASANSSAIENAKSTEERMFLQGIEADAENLEKTIAFQKEGQEKAIAATMEMFYTQRADLAPWRNTGEEALADLNQLIKQGPGDFTESPGYEFRLAEGVKALEQGAAARGKQFSGEQQKALTQYGQNVATSEYDNHLRRYYDKVNALSALAGTGQAATSTTAGFAGQAGNQLSSIYQGTANNIASAYEGYGARTSQAYQSSGSNQANLSIAGGNALANSYLQQGNIATSSMNTLGQIALYKSIT